MIVKDKNLSRVPKNVETNYIHITVLCKFYRQTN